MITGRSPDEPERDDPDEGLSAERDVDSASDAATVLDSLGAAVPREILVAGAGARPVTVDALVERCGVSESTVYRHLAALIDGGFVEKVRPTDPGGATGYLTRVRAVRTDVSPEGIAVSTEDGDGYRTALERVVEGLDVRNAAYDPRTRTVEVRFGVENGRFADVLEVLDGLIDDQPSRVLDAEAD